MSGAQPGFRCRHRQSCGGEIPAQSRENFDNLPMTFSPFPISNQILI
ncbi:hypothetical protein BURMUCF2_A2091 [Burkholderia multivorans CF2]|nr:hypothetical protein BURMUCF2_A2091 [Burkholderia multivorans CF2]